MQKVCGPRWKHDLNDYYAMNGICYWLNGSKDFDREATQLIPLQKLIYQGYAKYLREKGIVNYKNRDDFKFYYLYGEAGLSVDFLKNSSEIIIGAPGVLEWMGTGILSKGIHWQNGYDDGFIIPNPLDRIDVSISSYFGYSIGSGHFLSSEDILMVAGAPRDGNLKGKVFIYSIEDDESMVIRVMLEGQQLGEYFGAALCVVDLNSDGLDDLVIGAPQFSLSTSGIIQDAGDEGKVYVFINQDKGRFTEAKYQKDIMGSQQPGARFGTAISNVGDLNKDSYPDVAVGAPYDSFGHGAVYIYLGSAKGINPKFAQRISASKIDPNLQGFGMSISKGVDVDGNRYNDVAVGAYGSGQAVLFRSQPVIYFHAKLATDVYKINFTTKGFRLKACIHYTGQYAPPSIDSAVTISVDETYGRAHLIFNSMNQSVYNANFNLQYRVENCTIFDVNILKEFQDFSKQIEIKMKFELIGESDGSGGSSSEFCSKCAVVDPSMPSFIIHKVPYVTGCSADDVCKTDIKTVGSLTDISSPLVIGSTDSVQMKVLVRNSGDPAFLSQTNITFPRVTPLIRIPKNCEELVFLNGTLEMVTLKCEMGNPLAANEKKELVLEFDTKNIQPGTDHITFNISSGSAGEEVDGVDNIQEIQLPLKTVSDLSILGKSSPHQTDLATLNASFPDKGTAFHHVYEISNHGVSPVEEAKLTFFIPLKYKTPSGSIELVEIYHPKIKVDSTDLICNPVNFNYHHRKDVSIVRNETLNNLEQSTMKEKIEMKTEKKEGMSKPHHAVLSSLSLPERTHYINCSSQELECGVIECVAGPFMKSHQSRSVISLPLRINPKVLETLLEDKEIVVLSSFGFVEIQGEFHSIQPVDHRPDYGDASTIIYGKLPESKISPWFILLAILVGLLILALLIWLLVKMGFFRREKKEELKSQKNKDEMEAALTGNMDH
ncbi:integrin alpha-PS3-like isoform X2 [Ischnura elegans]|uniref:integrin alpha-PS3-like isoform X2 n=1 Tax=Ischnura elegans TaxID=197161 RepID=UPI001ED8BD43|nr:integrin alpha-PS3-like isoform X2 [Ischnura elegans]